MSGDIQGDTQGASLSHRVSPGLAGQWRALHDTKNGALSAARNERVKPIGLWAAR